LEIEISNKGFNYGKYERFYSTEKYKDYYPVMPTVFVVGDTIQLPDGMRVKYIIINTNMVMEGLL